MTLKEIAAEAGVSAMTVSNVINRNDDKVSEETRRRVQAVIDKYHYVPNMSARSLSARNSHIIAILLPVYLADPGKQGADGFPEREINVLSDPYSSMMVGLLEAKLKRGGYYVILRSFSSVGEVLQLQKSWQVDGCIMLTPMIDDEKNRFLLANSSCPLVIIDRHFPDLPMLSVSVNDYMGGYTATQECIRYGHRRVAFIATGGNSIENSTVIHSRYQGYQAALRDAGISEEPEWTIGFDNNYEGGRKCGEYLLSLPSEKRPTAIFATSDILAVGIIIAFREHGYRVPQDFSIVGYDNLTISSLFEPRLTTIAQDLDGKASAAVELITGAIQDPKQSDRTIHIDVTLIERDSVGPAPKDV